MTTFIANIGTSDLAVKVDDYYIPVRFDRNEPNLDESGLTGDEEAIWNLRQDSMSEQLCPELGVQTQPQKNPRFSFRELTEKLLEAYKKDENKWHSRISPGRLQGVIDTAKRDFGVNSAYIFVTNQQSLHRDDSIYLFQILKKWFQQEMEFELIDITIPPEVSPVDQDQLLDFYYQFFYKLDTQDDILVSIKGGTPQMQNALRLQAVSSTIPKQLFIDPKISVKNILHGQPSQCQLTTYWKYMRNQKYQTVQQLLERWDFDGAINILKNWQSSLTFLIEKDILTKEKVKQSRRQLETVINGLKIARSLFNFDILGARLIKDDNENNFNKFFQYNDFLDENRYDSLLNIYTQCCVYSDLSHIANFLARVGSLYENVICRIIENKGGHRHLNGRWEININSLRDQIGNELLDEFRRLERLRGLDDLQDFYSIRSNRFQKRNYAHILIKSRAENPNLEQESYHWLEEPYQTNEETVINGVLGLLKSLDYWIDKRNQLIHSAEGISQQRIQQLNDERLNNRRYQNPCQYDDIIPILTEILNNPLMALQRNYRETFVAGDKYYIYSDAKESAIALLMDDAANN